MFNSIFEFKSSQQKKKFKSSEEKKIITEQKALKDAYKLQNWKNNS